MRATCRKPGVIASPNQIATLIYWFGRKRQRRSLIEDPQFAKIASDVATGFGHPFLVGTIEFKPQADAGSASATTQGHSASAPYNSALLFNAHGQRVFSYDKIHLVPFGEYQPFPLINRIVNSVSDEVGAFHKGQTYAVGALPGGYSLECLFVTNPFTREKSGISWRMAQIFWSIFRMMAGSDALPLREQHLLMARVRAVENRRWLLRVTNNGYTASVDPYGRIYRAAAGRRARGSGLAVRLSHRSHHLHALRRLVRLALRDGFRYSVGLNFLERKCFAR